MNSIRSLFRQMNTLRFVLLLGGGLLASGCGKEVKAPTPLPLSELPSALETNFAKARPDTKQLADQIVGFVKAANHSQAFLQMQTLAGHSGLTKPQNQTVARGLLTLNNALQTAQSQGDRAAAQTLSYYRQNK